MPLPVRQRWSPPAELKRRLSLLFLPAHSLLCNYATSPDLLAVFRGRGVMLDLTFLWILVALFVGLLAVRGLTRPGTADRRRRLRESFRAIRNRNRQT